MTNRSPVYLVDDKGTIVSKHKKYSEANKEALKHKKFLTPVNSFGNILSPRKEIGRHKGWRQESARHAMARKGMKTKKARMSKQTFDGLVTYWVSSGMDVKEAKKTITDRCIITK